jgi:AcrR family transcriptional regulator
MPRGRRPGAPDTRGDLLTAAREEFAAKGYTGATVRAIAARAGLDPSMVHHYFGTKRGLFVAALELPFDPRSVVDSALAGDPGRAGERIVTRFLDLWESEAGGPALVSLLRTAVTDEQVMRMLREFVIEGVLAPVTERIAEDHHRTRAALLASQILGLAVARYVMRVEPLATADGDTVAALVAPVLQHYLEADLTPPDG